MRAVDELAESPAEAILKLAAVKRLTGDGPAGSVAFFADWLATGECNRDEVAEALALARAAFDRDDRGDYGQEEGPNFGQAVVILSRVLR